MTESPDYTNATATEDILSPYKISDLDDAGTPKYFGFTDKEGNWFIMQLTQTGARYARGTQNYPANWTARAGLTYDYFHITF